jgi:hypothetical protein
MPPNLARMKSAMWRQIHGRIQRFRQHCGGHGHMEPVYQHLFLRDLGRLGLADVYAPVLGAANYSLLYALLSIILVVEPKGVLELGSGQTTVLMNALRDAGVWAGNLVSLEHDPGWADYLATNVSTPVVLAPLHRHAVSDVMIDGYSTDDLPQSPACFDVLLVDGPPGTPRWSRLGCLDFIATRMARDFVVILDDYDRLGEQETAEEIRRVLRNRGVEFVEECYLSNKSQLVIATERYRACIYPRWSPAQDARATRPPRRGLPPPRMVAGA